MNTTLLHRLIWKEVRTLRPLWLSVLGIGIVLQFFYLLLFDLRQNGLEISQAWFGTAIVLPAVLGLASVAMAFAGEREEGTDQFLCRLGVPPLLLFVVKVSINIAGAVALFLVMFPFTMLLSKVFLPSQHFFDSIIGPLMQMVGFAWTVGLLAWGTFFSLLFRRVLPCLIAAVVATTLTMSFVDADLREDGNAGLRLLGVVSSVLLLLSLGLAQQWDEGRWPRQVEPLIWFLQKLSRLRLRVTSADGRTDKALHLVPQVLQMEIGSRAGILQALLRLVGLGQLDEWLPSWRRELRRLLWLEWQSAWWVFLGLVLAASAALLALLGTANSQADMRFVMTTLPLTLAFVAFAMGVWSFQGQQCEQRFQFFAAHGASPNAMWLVKHFVWLCFTVLAVMFLLGFASLVSDRTINRDEFYASGLHNLVETAFDDNLIWEKLERPEWPLRLVFLAARTTGTMPPEFFEPDEVTGVWPLVSLLWQAMERGVLAVWLCFAIGQFVSLLIPRAITALLVGVFPLGIAVIWWCIISLGQVPLLIAGCPVLLGLLAAAWGRMNDWLEERSGWRRWVRVSTTALIPMLVAFVGMATYRVYEVPRVEPPFRMVVPSLEARQTGEEWMRLAEQLDSPFAKPEGEANNEGQASQLEWHESLSSVAVLHWEDFGKREWLAAHAPTLDAAMQLSHRLVCVMPESWEPWNDRKREQFGHLALLIKMSAFESLANHRLDEALQRALALDRFGQHLGGQGCGLARWIRAVDVQRAAMHVLREWALSPDQTEESLLAVLGRPDNGQTHPIAQLVRAEGSFVTKPLEILQADYSAALEQHAERWRRVLPSPLRWMFWEQAREERLLNVLAQEGINNLNDGLDRRPWDNTVRQKLDAPYGRLLKDTNEKLDHWGSSTPRLSRGERWGQSSARTQLGLGWNERSLAMNFFPVLGSLETHRRALWLTIALQAYRVKHGRLPDRLDDLVGRYLDRLPSDPFNGLAFDYRPNGLPFIVHTDNRRIAENTPLLASSGEYTSRREPVTADYAKQFQIPVPRDEGDAPHTNNLTWVSIFGNGRRYGDRLAGSFDHRAVTFSLKPSF